MPRLREEQDGPPPLSPREMFGLIVAVLAVVGAGVGLFKLLTRNSPSQAQQDWIVVPGDSLRYHLRRLDSVEARTKAILEEIDLVHREAASVDSLQASAGLRDVARLRGELAAIRGRADEIERVIVRDPTKALELVLLRQEVDALRSQSLAAQASIRQDIDRVFLITQWVLGTLLALGIGNLILPRLWRSKGSTG